MLDTFSMVKEISVMEQRYQAVLAVIADGRGVGEVAAQFGVSRQSVHSWLRRYEDHGLEGLANRSHKPKSIPHQMPAIVEAAVLELRREHRAWGPRRRGLTRFCGHSRLVVSSCSNHDVVVELFEVGGADHSEAGAPPLGVIPTLNPLKHGRGELNPAGPGLPVE